MGGGFFLEAEVAVCGVDEEWVLGEAVFVGALVLLLGEEGLAAGGVSGAEVDIVVGVGVFGEGSDGGAEVFGFLVEDDVLAGVVEDVLLVGSAGEGAFVELKEHGRPFFSFVGAGADVGNDVVNAAVVKFDLHALGGAAVDEVFGDEGIALAAVGADRRLHYGGCKKVVDVVASDNVSGSGSTDVNAVAVVELLHDVVNFVEFDEVVVGMEEGADLFESGFWSGAGFVSADGADEFAGVPFFGKEFGHNSGDDDAGVGGVVDEVVDDAIFAALPKEDAGGVGLDFSNVVDVVILDEVVMTKVFGARAVARDENASAAEVLDVI